ncbi:hypothetical protein [Micromonospora sp. KC721]|uniref:hypothetical protein n=1 Tax=Micromonospora sp. KC721 TaxID=2530380 RepID=UPI0010473CAD|nr:hypothetical protein [Micromonospora sp. KC721]TDB71578.1 hypothetical protein E1182_24835 [Micromonospora sp. KC721]
MSEDLDLVERMRRELAAVRWAEPAQLRARARRRSRRTALSVAAAVLLVASAAGLAATGSPGAQQPTRRNQVAAAPVAHRAEIPLDALLQPGDLRQRTAPPLTGSGLAAPVALDGALGRCLRERHNWTGWTVSRYSRSQSVQLAESRNGALTGLYLTQDLYRLRAETAAGFLADVDRWVRVCADWSRPVEGAVPRAVMRYRWEVAARGFTGDEAILLRQTVSASGGAASPGDPGRVTDAVVRVGDLLTVVRLGPDSDEQELRRLAGVAASRMCVAANPPC